MAPTPTGAATSTDELRPTLPPDLDDSIVGTPARRPGSARRTATVDMTWPGGVGTDLHLLGRARDLLTPATGEAVVAAEAEMRVIVGDLRTVRAVECDPPRPGIERLVGTRGGSYLRGAIDEALPGEREAATPLHVLLDDVAGTSLIAGFAWMRWAPGVRRERGRDEGFDGPGSTFGMRKGRIICSGLRPGGFAQSHRPGTGGTSQALRVAGDISTPDDPWGWHQLPEWTGGPHMRRHRRIDLWPEGDRLVVDAFFRDTSFEPDGTALALHEYTVEAEIAPDLTLERIEARPRVLPYPECQWAAPHVELLRGKPVEAFRTGVQETLTELQCCTHLNDMLRCLTEVPALARLLATAGH